MQVSAVSVSGFSVFKSTDVTSSAEIIGENKNADNLNSTNTDLYDAINEWKAFCIEQIDANNIDFIA